MKTCPRCGFHHSDVDHRCVRCGGLLDPIGKLDPLEREDRKLPEISPLAHLWNLPLRLVGGLLLAFHRLRLRLIDPVPRHATARSPWLAGMLSLALPGAGQIRNHQPRKAVLFFLAWIGWLTAVAWTFFDPISNRVLLFGVLLIAFAWHDAFLTALTINRFGRTLAWQDRAGYYFAWICYIGMFCTALIWIGWWTVLQRKHIFHSELSPWIRDGEWALLEKISDHWMAPRVGDVVYYKPGPIHMEKPGGTYLGSDVSWSTMLDVRSINMIERIVAGPGETFEYRDGVFYRNGKRVPPKDAPLRTDQLAPFRLTAPEGKYIIVYSYTGAGFDPIPIATLHDDYKLRQQAPALNDPGWIVTGWEAACYIAPRDIDGRMWLVYNPPPVRRFLD